MMQIHLFALLFYKFYRNWQIIIFWCVYLYLLQGEICFSTRDLFVSKSTNLGEISHICCWRKCGGLHTDKKIGNLSPLHYLFAHSLISSLM